MNGSIQIHVYRHDRPPFLAEFDQALEIGRQDQAQADPGPVSKRTLGERQRLVIVHADKVDVSKRQLLIEPLSARAIRVTNLSQVRSVPLADGSELACGETRELPLPQPITLGDALLRIDTPQRAGSGTRGDYHRLESVSITPGTMLLTGAQAAPAWSALDAKDVASLAQWLQTLTAVLQSAASSNEFYQQAARAIVELVGLDTGAVLLFQADGTHTEAVWSSTARCAPDWSPSERILARLRHDRQTLWKNPQADNLVDGSLVQVQAVVAAPILNPAGDVIGALYGDRRSLGGAIVISSTEAMLVQTLAAGVAAGLARVEQEKAAIAAQVRFEQFFSPELSRQLTIEPDMLRGRDAEVTILFCDIRAFSRVAHRIGPALTFDWINSVMSALSDCVARHDGVLVDFIGDELIAMWGAPREQQDHAQLACRAACDMLRALDAVNERWQAAIGVPTELGIGINSGVARVGNTGSHRRFKYGPLGNTVNLGSRVQGATKYLQVGLMITEATRQRIDDSFAPRRLCQVRVVNIDEPVTLYELPVVIDEQWAALRAQYEAALSHFERREFHQALSIIGQLLTRFPNDGPARALGARTLQATFQDDGRFQSIWELTGK